MQQALPWSAGQASGAVPALSASRRNKFVAGSVAALGASVIAITPVTSTSPALIEAQHRAVQLVADVTASPDQVYGDLFSSTISNLTALGENWAANPFPLASQVIQNQTGYATQVSTAIQSIPTVLQSWYQNGKGESKPGAEYLANFQAAIAAGDFNTAYDNLNRFMLFGLQNLATPITGIFLSSTDRQTGEYNAGIPEQMAQNFANTVAVVFSSTTMLSGVFQSVFAPLSGAAWEVARANEAISAAAANGDAQAALTALVNTPGVVVNAMLNGFDYQDGDTTAPWAGLLTGCIGKSGRCGAGALEQLLISIPTKIAAAIDNTPATTSLASALGLSSLVPETKSLSATTPTAAADGTTVTASDEVVSDDTAAADTSKTATLAAKLVSTDAATDAAPATADAATDAAPATDAETAKETKSSTDSKKLSNRLNAAAKKLGDKLKGNSDKDSTSETGSAASSASTGASATGDSSTGASKASSKTAKKAAKSAKKAAKKSAKKSKSGSGS